MQTYRAPGAMDPFFELFGVSPWLRWVASHMSGYELKVRARVYVGRGEVLRAVWHLAPAHV